MPVPSRVKRPVDLLDRHQGEAAVVYEHLGSATREAGAPRCRYHSSYWSSGMSSPSARGGLTMTLPPRHPAPGLFLGIGSDRPTVEGGYAEACPGMGSGGSLPPRATVATQGRGKASEIARVAPTGSCRPPPHPGGYSVSFQLYTTLRRVLSPRLTRRTSRKRRPANEGRATFSVGIQASPPRRCAD